MSIYFKWTKDWDKKIEQRKIKMKIKPLLESLRVSDCLVIKYWILDDNNNNNNNNNNNVRF